MSKAKIAVRQKPPQQSGVMLTYGRPMEYSRCSDADYTVGVVWNFQASRSLYQLEGRPHTMSAPTSLLVIIIIIIIILLYYYCCSCCYYY